VARFGVAGAWLTRGGLDVNRASRDLLERLLDAEGVPSGCAQYFLDTVIAARGATPYRSLAELPVISGYGDLFARDLSFERAATGTSTAPVARCCLPCRIRPEAPTACSRAKDLRPFHREPRSN